MGQRVDSKDAGDERLTRGRVSLPARIGRMTDESMFSYFNIEVDETVIMLSRDAGRGEPLPLQMFLCVALPDSSV